MNSPRPTSDPNKPLDNKNTLKKTKFDLRIIEMYLSKAQESRELLTIPVEELDDHLANFISTHRKQDGSEYEPGTLRGILGSLDRHFEKFNYPCAIYRSKETKFQKTVKAMKVKQSYLKTIGKGNHPNHAEPLTEHEIELLYSTGTIGLHTPTALLHMLFFNIGLHFSLRTMEQHSLKWGDILLKADPQGRKYLEHTKKLAPSRTSGKLHPTHTMRMQIYESPEQPERDVVRAYEKYAVERPEKMKRKDAPFYLTPQPDCRPGYARWFKNLPMGETRIRSIMKNLKVAAGLSPQKRIANHSIMKTGSMRGQPPKAKPQRGTKATNGPSAITTNGLTSVKHEDHGHDDALDPEAAVQVPADILKPTLPASPIESKYDIGSHKSKKIKEEWDTEAENPLPMEDNVEEKSFLRGPVSVTFHDVAACFSAEEWGLLEDWQKELYRNVMREIHSALQAMGYTIMNSDVLLKIKENEMGTNGHKQDTASDHGNIGVSPDILLRIKHDNVPHWREPEEAEKEGELDTSNSSLPVFDPDLSLWIFREEPESSSSDEAKDQVLPTDADAEGDSSLFKEPTPDFPALYVPPYIEGPRPGKRKRRPPQRRSSEQMPVTDDEEQEEVNHQFLQRDTTPHEKLYQCDLCDKSFSDRTLRTSMHGMAMSCPQCGGALNIHPLYNRSQSTDTDGSLYQGPHLGDSTVYTGYRQPMQGPVG
ncbi:uncharacterized protein O3C94_004444 [Discoglossus pictus]